MTNGASARAVEIWHSLPLRGWFALLCASIGLAAWIYLGFSGHPFYGALACMTAVGEAHWILANGQL